MYIIVIDVDNNRARLAYKRGLDDLARVWGQLMLTAKEKDDVRIAKHNKDMAEYEELHKIYLEKYNKSKAIYDTQKKDFEEKLAQWETTKNNFFSGERPIRPRMEEGWINLNSPHRPRSRDSEIHKQYYESIKEELTNKYNLADAAIGPFRMTEGDVKVMIAWEDGSRVEKLLNIKNVGYCLGHIYEQ